MIWVIIMQRFIKIHKLEFFKKPFSLKKCVFSQKTPFYAIFLKNLFFFKYDFVSQYQTPVHNEVLHNVPENFTS